MNKKPKVQQGKTRKEFIKNQNWKLALKTHQKAALKRLGKMIVLVKLSKNELRFVKHPEN